MKIVALLSGLLASAFAWAAGIYIDDISAEFLALWPDTVSLQFLGLVAWHGIVACAALGGVMAVFSPLSGAIVLAAVAGTWGWLALTLPIGPNPQMIAPIVISGFGVMAAVGAIVRGRARRRAEHVPTREELEREEALRLEPSEGVLPVFDLSESLKPEPEPEPAAMGVVPPSRPAWHNDGPPRGISWLLASNVAVLIFLCGAVGILLYSELRSGDLGAAFSPSGPRASHVSEGLPRMAEAQSAPQAREDAAGAGSDRPPADRPVSTPPASAENSGALTPIEPHNDTTSGGEEGVPRLSDSDARSAAPAGTGVERVALEGGEWSDPFSYCAAVGTVDFPDRRYSGPYLVSAVADALRVPVSSSPDRVRWRCFEGDVMGCASFNWPVCAMTPSVPEMVEFCSKNPNARGLQAPNGNWSCNGTRPEIPAGENWPVDDRGFLPAAWIAIPPSSTG